MNIFSKVFSDIFTSANGDYDPARVIGYGIVALGSMEYLVLQAYVAIVSKQFDSTSFATGLAGISAALLAAAGGVWIKKSTEIPPSGESK